MGSGVADNDLNVLKQLAQISVVRGQDGAGLLQGSVYTKHMNYTVEKTGNEMAYLLWYHEKGKGGDRSLFNSHTDNFFCGHVRAATRGNINADNAHPFELDTLVGMHNGTLESSDYFPGIKETDSEMMFKDMEKRGIREVLAGLNKKSAYAVVIFDKKKREFIFARNELRPLFCTWNLNRKVMYWASEVGMLEWILDRNGIKYHNICNFTSGLIHRISPLDIQHGKRPNWIIEKISSSEPEKKDPIVYQHEPKPFTEFSEVEVKSIPAQIKPPHLRVVENKPSPLPEQQKAKEKDQKGSALSPKSRKEIEKRPTYPRSALRKSCCGCGKDMDLLEQYTGNEISVGRYLCKACDLKYEELGKMTLLN